MNDKEKGCGRLRSLESRQNIQSVFEGNGQANEEIHLA